MRKEWRLVETFTHGRERALYVGNKIKVAAVYYDSAAPRGEEKRWRYRMLLPGIERNSAKERFHSEGEAMQRVGRIVDFWFDVANSE